MEVSGILIAGESTPVLGYRKGRTGISPRQSLVLIILTACFVGLPLPLWLADSWVDALLGFEMAILGIGVGIAVNQRMMRPSFKRALAARGQPSEHATTFSLNPETVTVKIQDVTITAPWNCVTDLYRAPKHWGLIAQTTLLVLPCRFFPTEGEERAFISEILTHMTEEARARSADAVKFANG